MSINIAGHKINTWVLVGGGAGLLLVIYIYKRGSSSSASGTTSGTGTDSLTGLPYSQDNTIDPLTGMTYLQEAQEYGSVSAAQAAVSSGGGAYGSSYSGSGGGYVGTAGYPTSNVAYPANAGGSGYTTNAQWAQAVQAGLGALGYGSEAVGAAIGLYLNNMPLNATNTTIVQTAVAEYGPPPVGSYAIVQQGNGTSSTGGTPAPVHPAASVQVPNLIGQNLATAIRAIENAGLKEHTATSGIANPSNWVVKGQSPNGGKLAPGATVTLSATQKK